MRRLLLLLCLLSTSTMAQSVLDVKLDGSEVGKKLATYLVEIEQTKLVRFYFIEEWIDEIQQKANVTGKIQTMVNVALYLLAPGYTIKAQHEFHPIGVYVPALAVLVGMIYIIRDSP